MTKELAILPGVRVHFTINAEVVLPSGRVLRLHQWNEDPVAPVVAATLDDVSAIGDAAKAQVEECIRTSLLGVIPR